MHLKYNQGINISQLSLKTDLNLNGVRKNIDKSKQLDLIKVSGLNGRELSITLTDKGLFVIETIEQLFKSNEKRDFIE